MILLPSIVATYHAKTTTNVPNLTLCGRAAHASAVEAGKKRTRDNGNKKNKDYRKYSSHRRIYRKKKNPTQKIQSTRHVEKQTELDQGVESLSASTNTSHLVGIFFMK